MLLAVVVAAAGCRGGNDEEKFKSALLVAASDFAGANAVYSLGLDRDGKVAGGLRTINLGVDPRLDPVLAAPANLGGAGPVLLRREWGSATGLGALAWLDPDEDFGVAYTAEVGGPAAPANPQDFLRLAPDKAYVSRFGPAFDDVLIINPATGEHRGKISLAGLADNADGLARPTRMLRVGNRVYLLLQDINAAFSAYGNGKIAVINPATDQVLRVIDLVRKNPQVILWEPERGLLLVCANGDWADPATAGIETVDPETDTVTTVVAGDNPAIVGFLGDLADLGGGRLLVLDNKADWSGSYVLPVNLDTGAVAASIYFSFYLTDLAADRHGRLLVADNAAGKILALNPKTGAVKFSFNLAVPPQSIIEWSPEE
jgi:hypothetical protein